MDEQSQEPLGGHPIMLLPPNSLVPKPLRQFRGETEDGYGHIIGSSWGYYLIFHHLLPLSGQPDEGL